jgi:hypothetical protein
MQSPASPDKLVNAEDALAFDIQIESLQEIIEHEDLLFDQKQTIGHAVSTIEDLIERKLKGDTN